MKTVMKMVKKYGNSGGIYLPSDWIGGKVSVNLVDEPMDPMKDVLEKISLEHVISVILFGSYARNEAQRGSDIDMIIVTDEGTKLRIPGEIKKNYDVRVLNLHALKKSVASDPLLYKAIKDDAVALINHSILDELRDAEPPYIMIEERLDMIESSVKITKNIIEIDSAQAAELAYPVILRLKEVIIIECLLDDKKYFTHLLEKEIMGSGISKKEVTGILSAYRSVRDERVAGNISEDSMKKLIMLLEEKIENVREKARKQRH
jgi:predicted nucleotidyltransferase